MVNIHKKKYFGGMLSIDQKNPEKNLQKLNVLKMNENTNLFALTLTQQWFYVYIFFLLRQNWIAVIYYYNRIPKELYKMKDLWKMKNICFRTSWHLFETLKSLQSVYSS